MIINLGDAPFKAFITVTYPNGTCTVSLGDKSFTHSGGGTHTFIVNKKGTWTVTATASTGLTRTTTANVTKMGQTVNVTLSYRLYLYNQGDECTSITGGWSTFRCTKNAANMFVDTGDYNLYGFAYTNANVDISKYNNLYMYLTGSSVYSGAAAYLRVYNSPSAATNPSDTTNRLANIKYENFSGAFLFQLNVSTLSAGAVWGGALGKFTAGGAGILYISQIWLDV